MHFFKLHVNIVTVTMLLRSGLGFHNIRTNFSLRFLRTQYSEKVNECNLRQKLISLGTTSSSSSKPVVSNPTEEQSFHDHITTKDYAILCVSCLSLASAFIFLMNLAGNGSWRYFVAGGICSSISHSIATPIDVLKTRQQIETIDTQNKLEKEEEDVSLLAGLGPTAFGYLIEGAAKFGIYEVLKPIVKRFLVDLSTVLSIAQLNSKLLSFVICGSIAGTVASFILCPMEALRIRLVSEPEEFSGDGWLKAGYLMLKNEGVSSLWKGMTAMLAKQIPYTITKNVAFDFFMILAHLYVKSSSLVLDMKTKILIPFISAFGASCLTVVSSQPGDMILSLVNAHEGQKRTREFVKDVIKNYGIHGFFVGIKARILHVTLIVTSQLFMYDFVKRFVGLAATSSL